jgi:hypothetical protein
MNPTTLLIGGFLIAVASAQDVRDKVVPAATEAKLPTLIDPDLSIYGVLYGVSEDEFISRFGKATGYVRITPHESGMIFGRNHCFFFTDGKLSGVRITSSILDWRINNRISAVTPFNSVNWSLTNGIGRDINLGEVKRILGERLMGDGKDGSYYYYLTNRVRVDIDFYRSSSDGDTDEALRVSGLVLRLKEG